VRKQRKEGKKNIAKRERERENNKREVERQRGRMCNS
jgi:hypothetical protein